MNASHFFRTAKDNKERAIFDNINQMVEESITRIANKNELTNRKGYLSFIKER